VGSVTEIRFSAISPHATTDWNTKAQTGREQKRNAA